MLIRTIPSLTVVSCELTRLECGGKSDVTNRKESRIPDGLG